MTNNQTHLGKAPRNAPTPSLPAETKVLDTRDGEPGSILNGFAYDSAAGEWTEYEVVTRYGVERWQRRDFILFSEFQNNAQHEAHAMRIKRIELEGSHGGVAIARPGNSAIIRIDSIVSDPGEGEQAWKTWEIEAKDTDDTELFWIATEVQRRCDGVVGTNSMVHDYYRELQRFAD